MTFSHAFSRFQPVGILPTSVGTATFSGFCKPLAFRRGWFSYNGAGFQTVFPSPDARHVAYLWRTDATSTRLSLFIKPIGASNHSARLLQSTLKDSRVTDFRDIRWSPDGHFIAYRWDTKDGAQYIAISDTAGNQIARRVLDHVPNNVISVNLHGWSGDGKYLAVSYYADQTVDDLTPPTTIHILSAPTLQSIETPLLTSNLRPRNTGGDNTSADTYDMVQWSASGDWLDYLTTKPDEHDTLTLYSPSTGQMLTADTSATSNLEFPAQVLWSPDGKHVAVLTPQYVQLVLTPQYVDLQSQEFITWKVDIFGIDGSIFYTVSDSATPSFFEPNPRTLAEFSWSADSRSLIYSQSPDSFDFVHGDLVAFNLDHKQAILLHSNIYLSPSMTFDDGYVLASWDAGSVRKIDVIDAKTLQRIMTLDALYDGTPDALHRLAVYGSEADQVFGDYSQKSGWLIVREGGIATWAVNIRTSVQRPLLPAFPTYTEQDRHEAASFTADNRFIGGLETYSPDQINSNYRVFSLDDGIFHNFHLPPSVVDPILVDYSSDGEVTLSSNNDKDGTTLISVLRSDSSIRRQFKTMNTYTGIQPTICERN